MLRTRVTALAVLAALLLMLFGSLPSTRPVSAAGDPGTRAEETLAPHYSEESDPNLGYLLAVYTVTWAGFFGYIVWVSMRQRAVRQEITYLKRLLDAQNEMARSEADTDG